MSKKRKVVISLMCMLLILLVVYMMILPKRKTVSKSEVANPYTNWMSEPNKEEEVEEKGVITFEQDDEMK